MGVVAKSSRVVDVTRVDVMDIMLETVITVVVAVWFGGIIQIKELSSSLETKRDLIGAINAMNKVTLPVSAMQI